MISGLVKLELIDIKEMLGVSAKCAELRAKLGGLFIERIQTMNINTELSEEDINDKIKKAARILG